jgi:hypothetical protein
MSNLAVGPAYAIDGPLPRPPEYRLLSVPGVLQAGGREMNGVSVWGYPCDTPSLWDPCFSDGTFGTKLDTSTSPSASFFPFAAYLPFTCSTITANPAEFKRRAERVIEATISHAVEQALAHGVQGSSNPYFGDGNLDALGSGALDPNYALAYLEDAIGGTGRQGMIHATPGIVSAWGFEKLKTNGELRTANGTLVVSGSGYRGAAPASEQAPAAGEDWAFATGPVQVFIEDGPMPTISEFVDREDNTATYRAEKFVVAEWDTCLQAGALISWGSAA